MIVTMGEGDLNIDISVGNMRRCYLSYRALGTGIHYSKTKH